MYSRTGRLFSEHFGRIEVSSDHYFSNLIFYIHYNPQEHGFVDDFRHWPWSLFGALSSDRSTHLCRCAVMDWYGGEREFVAFHRGAVDEHAIQALLEDDLD